MEGEVLRSEELQLKVATCGRRFCHPCSFVSFPNHVNEDASLHDRVNRLAIQVLSNENLLLGEIIGSVER